MKESTLEVLFYLFDNYPDLEDEPDENRESMDAYLQDAGFMPGEIDRAFDWLESLGDEHQTVLEPFFPESMRIFSPREQRWLNAECQSYLLFLEQSGILTASSREQVIDRVMALEEDELSLDRLKWVAMMVLMNDPAGGDGFFWAEGVSLDGSAPVYH